MLWEPSLWTKSTLSYCVCTHRWDYQFENVFEDAVDVVDVIDAVDVDGNSREICHTDFEWQALRHKHWLALEATQQSSKLEATQIMKILVLGLKLVDTIFGKIKL